MIVNNIRWKKVGNRTIFSADFTINSLRLRRRRDIVFGKLRKLVGLPPLSQKIWFDVPTKECDVAAASDAFFIAAYPMAFALNEDLYFEGEVSSVLVENLPQVKDSIGFEKSATQVFVGKTTFSKKKKKKSTAQFFTLGLDSFHTLLSERPKTLIFVNGYDVPRNRSVFLKEIKRRITAVSREAKVQPIFVTSNLRDLSNKTINWEVFFVAAVAAVGTLLSKNLTDVYINGSYFPKENIHGGGEHIDRLWSNDFISFHPIGYRETRIEKVQQMIQSPLFDLVEKHVRVCWKNVDQKNVAYNCSRCEKCLRTQFALLACGKKAKTFTEIDPQDLPHISVPAISREQWKAIYRLMKDRPSTDPRIVEYLHSFSGE
jgi:hypothetical protein